MLIGKNDSRYKYLMNWVALEASDKEKDVEVIIQEDFKPIKQCASAVAMARWPDPFLTETKLYGYLCINLCTAPPWMLYTSLESLAD